MSYKNDNFNGHCRRCDWLLQRLEFPDSETPVPCEGKNGAEPTPIDLSAYPSLPDIAFAVNGDMEAQ
jgi:hypothetical protein